MRIADPPAFLILRSRVPPPARSAASCAHGATSGIVRSSAMPHYRSLCGAGDKKIPAFPWAGKAGVAPAAGHRRVPEPSLNPCRHTLNFASVSFRLLETDSRPSASETSPSLMLSCSLLREATCSDVAEDCWETALTLLMASDSVCWDCSSCWIESVTSSSL